MLFHTLVRHTVCMCNHKRIAAINKFSMNDNDNSSNGDDDGNGIRRNKWEKQKPKAENKVLQR